MILLKRLGSDPHRQLQFLGKLRFWSMLAAHHPVSSLIRGVA
ncbi:hypothetical protein [Sulfitobacter sabulilitoris]|nr:hypothetical protein [Sulfitobacter sabulilitoris]